MSLPHAFTIDTEDWAALMCMYLGRTIDVGAQFTSSIDYVLALLDEYQTKVTFYVIASQAVQQPAAVREIVSRGHELGSHGWVTRLQTAVSSPKS